MSTAAALRGGRLAATFAVASVLGLQGCAVAGATAGAAIAVTGAVVSSGIRMTAKAIGAGVDAVSSSPGEQDASGIVVRERIRPADAAAPTAPRCAPVAGDGAKADCD